MREILHKISYIFTHKEGDFCKYLLRIFRLIREVLPHGGRAKFVESVNVTRPCDTEHSEMLLILLNAARLSVRRVWQRLVFFCHFRFLVAPTTYHEYLHIIDTQRHTHTNTDIDGNELHQLRATMKSHQHQETESLLVLMLAVDVSARSLLFRSPRSRWRKSSLSRLFSTDQSRRETHCCSATTRQILLSTFPLSFPMFTELLHFFFPFLPFAVYC